MNRLVVCAITVLAVTVVACSDENTSGEDAGLNNPFSSVVLDVDSSPVTLHVKRNPADTIPKTDTAHYKKVPYYVGDDAVDRTPTVIVLPSGDTVSNGLNNVAATFSNDGIAEFNDDGELVGDTVGTTVLTYTFTDYNHNHATTSVDIPVTVSVGPPAPSRVHFRRARVQVLH
jgi:hypothetical protein